MSLNMSKHKFRKLPVLGLIMIVKDESHIITEALQSIVDFIDTYVISDTGSTDGTQEIIKKFFEDKGIPGCIFQDEWSDFGTNRSLVLEHAQNKMQYAWMVDADDLVKMPEEIKTKKDFHKLLDEHYDAFKVGIVDEGDSVFYWRTQIFNMRKKWKYDGVLHEFPTLVNPRTNTDVNNMKELPAKVISRRLGARNKMDIKEKYRKDADMLLKGLEKEPMNSRYMFYLAQSFRDCEEYQRSVDWYQRRVDLGGWYEEVFYSLYMIGKMYLFHLGNEPLGIKNSLKAFSVHPKRVESMYSLIHYYKMHSDYRMALMYTRKVKDIPFPKEDGLFLENELYSHVIKSDYMILSFLTFQPYDEYDLGDKNPECMEHLRILQTFPSIVMERAVVIPFPKEMIPQNPNPMVEKHRPYRVFNPSVAKNTDTGDVWVIIRCSNFDVHYQPTDKDGMIRTENFLATMDLSKIYKLVDKSAFYEKYRANTEARILGYEDIRLFYMNGHWCFLANNDEITGHINSPQVVFGRLAKEPIEEHMTWHVEYVVHLKFPYQQKIEKNWVPLIPDGEMKTLDIVYSSQPVMIITPDLATGFCFVKHQLAYTPQLPFPQEYTIRNSTPYVPFRDGWIGLGHVVYFLKEYRYQRIYYSIWIWMSHDFTNVRISNFFHFDHHIVEFANGLARTPDNNQIMVSFSLSDSIPKTVTFQEDDIANMLLP